MTERPPAEVTRWRHYLRAIERFGTPEEIELVLRDLGSPSSVRERNAKMERQVSDLHRALLEKGADGDAPMIDRIALVVVAAERGEWAVRWGLRCFAALSAIAAAVIVFRDAIRSFFEK